MLARTLILAIVGATLVGACSRSEPPAPKAQPVVPKAAPIARPSAGAEIDEGLKERLARQEAAARTFERNVLQPPPPRVPEPPPAAVKAAQPAPPPAAGAPVPVQPPSPRSEPPRTEATPPASASQRASPPPAAPRTDVAGARPAPAPDSTAARLLNRVVPDFPREAVQSGVEQGKVRARMTLDARGNVTRVEILEATPRRVFDRAVVQALSQWRYSDGPDGRTVDMEVAFKR